MEIRTKSASLETMAVTIQALHVNGKQMTLAVFRQLPIGYLEDDAVSQPWGVVNYSVRDEGDMWLVYSKGTLLFRRPLHIDEWTSDRSNLRIAQKRQEMLQANLAAIKRWAEPEDRHGAKQTADVLEADKAVARETDAWNAAESARKAALAHERSFVDTLPQLFIAV